jgi:hypothetical protein
MISLSLSDTGGHASRRTSPDAVSGSMTMQRRRRPWQPMLRGQEDLAGVRTRRPRPGQPGERPGVRGLTPPCVLFCLASLIHLHASSFLLQHTGNGPLLLIPHPIRSNFLLTWLFVPQTKEFFFPYHMCVLRWGTKGFPYC